MLGCVKAFDPGIESENSGYLVVDANIDLSLNSSEITLTRTLSLESINTINYETGAEVTIESMDGKTMQVFEESEGHYIGDLSGISDDVLYRLNIHTQSEENYQSSWVPVKISPPIDSVSWDADDAGLNVYVNTHDPDNNSKFYRWDYVETCEFNSMFHSKGIYDDSINYVRTRDQLTENIHVCWRDDPSTRVILANSTMLTEDVIVQKEITKVPPESWKHRFKYSILVKQYVLTSEEYDYWLTIQQNNESIGSLFDAQPSTIGSNISCISAPEKPVLGFFSMGYSSDKRLFVGFRDLPKWKKGINVPFNCLSKEPYFIPINEFLANPYENLIIDLVYDLLGNIVGITTSDWECIECSFVNRGYTTTPDYWEN